MSDPVFLNALGIVNPLGRDKEDVARNLFAGSQAGMKPCADLIPGKEVMVGMVDVDLPLIDDFPVEFHSRNNQLVLAALLQIENEVRAAINQYGKDRVAVVFGTSTAGICEGEKAVAEKVLREKFPEGYRYEQQEMGNGAAFVQALFGLDGLAYTVSTACTSSAKAVASARRLVRAGLCDAVIVGGADSLCALTLNGFNALESLAKGICNPFSKNRNGLNIGEGAAFFLMSRENSGVQLAGVGENSDAHHISAPDPFGEGAAGAMKMALQDAGLEAEDVAYINLHGTATPLNDAMEAVAVENVFSLPPACSSTKSLTGHMLGAAGANELAFLWLSLTGAGDLPPHIWDGEPDAGPSSINFVRIGERYLKKKATYMMSNSFAFGGNNISLVLGVVN